MQGMQIGNLIRKEQVHVRTLTYQRQVLLNQIKVFEARKPADEEGQTKATLDQKAWAYEMRIQRDQLEFLEAKIYELFEKSLDFMNIEESLPIDRDRVKALDEPSAFASECFIHITLGRDRRDKGDIKEFISNHLDDIPSAVPQKTIDSLALQVEHIFQTKTDDQINLQVSLVASCITLNRVRTLDPITFSKNSTVSHQLKSECDNYYVLSEAVLGGVFIGLGKSLANGQVVGGQIDPATISRIQMCSFFSQGAILQIKESRDKIDMWAIYSDWKESLLKDKYAGFPVRFKFRELRSILEYNKISNLPERPIFQNPRLVPDSKKSIEQNPSQEGKKSIEQNPSQEGKKNNRTGVGETDELQ